MAIRTAKNEFDLIYNYYLDLKENAKSKAGVDGNGNYNDIRSKLFYFIVELYQNLRGKENFPHVLCDEKYSAMKSNEYYHGFEYNKYAVNFLEEQQYHYGTGIVGDGFHVTNSLNAAIVYTDQLFEKPNGDYDFKSSPKRVLRMRLNTSNVMDYQDLFKIGQFVNFVMGESEEETVLPELSNQMMEKLNSFIAYAVQTNDHEFIKAVMPRPDDYNHRNASSLAAILGVDVIKVVRSKKLMRKDYIVLYRDVICVPESELIKFKAAAENEVIINKVDEAER